MDIHANNSCLNHAVRRANVPEMLNEDYMSDVEEGIFFVRFLFCCFSLAFPSLVSTPHSKLTSFLSSAIVSSCASPGLQHTSAGCTRA